MIIYVFMYVNINFTSHVLPSYITVTINSLCALMVPYMYMSLLLLIVHHLPCHLHSNELPYMATQQCRLVTPGFVQV